MKKRVLAMIMSVAMMLSLLPATTLATESTVIRTADELKTAVSAGGTYTVAGNIEVTETFNITTSLTLGGSGTITKGTFGTEGAENNLFVVKDTGTLTLKDTLTLQGKSESGKEVKDQCRGWLVCLDSGATGSVTIQDNATLQNNHGSNGGAIRVRAGTLNINGGTFTGNWAYWVNNNGTSVGNGGVLYASAGTVNITAGTFEDNHSTGHGGAIAADGSATLNISGGTFRNNVAGGSYGGAVHASGINMTLLGGTFTNNHCSAHGGGVDFLGASNAEKTLIIGGNLGVYSNTATDSNTASNLYLEPKTQGKVKIQSSLTTDEKIRITVAGNGELEITAEDSYQITESDVSKLEHTSQSIAFVLTEENKIVTTAAVMITFNANYGDTPSTDSQKIPTSSTATLAANKFTNPGYTFTGWSTQQSGGETTYADQESITPSEDMTLYAQWAECTSHLWTKATCTTPKTCSLCKETDGEALEHSWDEGVVTTNPSYTTEGVRTHTCTATDCDATKTEAIPVLTRPSGGSSKPSYAVTAPETENGGVKLSPASAKAGRTVTVTPTPDEGYQIAALTVTDKDGKAIEVTDNGDGTYSFKMPAGKVSVEATFEPIPPVKPPFEDVSEADWYYESVQYVFNEGLMTGTSETTFDPNGTSTRAMIWTVLARLAGETIEGANWAEDAQAWAVQAGISDGTAPDSPITREQLITMLYRATETPTGAADLSKFADSAAVSPYAQHAMAWAVAIGLIQGDDQGLLNPGATATRAEVATILMRFCETVA